MEYAITYVAAFVIVVVGGMWIILNAINFASNVKEVGSAAVKKAKEINENEDN